MAKIVDPELIADIISALNVQGALAPFDISQIAFPVFDIGRLAALNPQPVVTPNLLSSVRVGLVANNHLTVANPPVQDTEIVFGLAVAPAGGTILADTGQLAVGVHTFQGMAGHNDGVTRQFDLEWRNAANAANLMVWSFMISNEPFVFDLVPNISVANERFRWVNVSAVIGNAATSVQAVRNGEAFAA